MVSCGDGDFFRDVDEAGTDGEMARTKVMQRGEEDGRDIRLEAVLRL